MNENVPTYRAGCVTVIGKTTVTYAEMRELRLLLVNVSKTSAAAVDFLGNSGLVPAGSLQRARELTARLEVLVDRAKQILN